MFIALFKTVFIAIIIGDFSEKTGFTRNGYLISIIVCVGVPWCSFGYAQCSAPVSEPMG